MLLLELKLDNKIDPRSLVHFINLIIRQPKDFPFKLNVECLLGSFINLVFFVTREKKDI